MFGVRAEKLNADRPLDLIEVEIFPGPLVAAKNSFGGNEFGGEHIRAVFLAELAKNLVRDPGHRREIKRKTVLEPGQRVHIRFCRKIVSNAAGSADRKSTRLNSSHSQISYAVF